VSTTLGIHKSRELWEMLKELTCSPSFFNFQRGNRTTIQINQVITTKTTEHCCNSQISHMPISNYRPPLPYISVKVGYAIVHFQDAIFCCPVQDAIFCCPVQDAILCCPVQDAILLSSSRCYLVCVFQLKMLSCVCACVS